MPEQFVVPQFIDVEDKIFGPVTTRQFIILLIGSLMIFICFKLLDTTAFIFALAFLGSISLILAFVKINGQAFHYFLLNTLQTMRRPSLRIWDKRYTTEELKYYINTQTEEIVEEVPEVRKVSNSRIRDLSLIVNTGGYYKPE